MSTPALTAPPEALLAPTRAARDWLTPVELLVLATIWGASFLFMRVASPEFGTAALVEMRLGLGALALLPWLVMAGSQFSAATWLRLAGIGLLNSALPFALFAWASQRAPAGVSAIANATTVLFTALIGLLFFGERLCRRRVIAMLIGFSGVVVLASDRTGGANLGLPALAAATAALCYGISANLIRRYLSGLPASALAAATLLSGAILCAPFALAQWPTQTISGQAWLSAILIGVLCTGVAYLIYFRLIQRVGPSRASTVTYLVPLFAMLWAWGLLDEVPTAAMLSAGALIVGSVAFSQRIRVGVVGAAESKS